MKRWAGEIDKLKQAEVKARKDLKEGGDVKQYEAI